MTRRKSVTAALALTLGLWSTAAYGDVGPINATGVIRISGADRYEVSANVSTSTATPPQNVVFVASGEVFSDALAAGPAASRTHAPIMLVRKSAVPASVAVEIKRLKPANIYLMGGPATVSPSTAVALGAINGAKVTRLAGADRYEVAASMSDGFNNLKTIYIASGEVSPDALAAGPAVSKEGGAILLTRGTSLPVSTKDALLRHQPERVVIVGGPATISAEVEDQIRAILPAGTDFERYEGRDRYEVAANVAAKVFGDGATAGFYASGEKFPDALSGTPAADGSHAPILLTTATCTPYETAKWTQDHAPTLQVLLGGDQSSYEGTTVCGPAPTWPDLPKTLTCDDFESTEAAQQWFDYWEPRIGDKYELDTDGDGVVCTA